MEVHEALTIAARSFLVKSAYLKTSDLLPKESYGARYRGGGRKTFLSQRYWPKYPKHELECRDLGFRYGNNGITNLTLALRNGLVEDNSSVRE